MEPHRALLLLGRRRLDDDDDGACRIVEDDLSACSIEVGELRESIHNAVQSLAQLEESAKDVMPWIVNEDNNDNDKNDKSNIDIQLGGAGSHFE